MGVEYHETIACAGRKVAVVGDAVLDVYLEGNIGRLCREAPIPVVDVQERKCIAGGAGNTAVNAHEMGGCVKLLSVAGDDWAGERLRQTLRERGVATDGLVVEAIAAQG